MGWDLQPLGELTGTEGSLILLWEEKAAPVRGRQDRVRPLQMVLTTALLPKPERVSTIAHKGWVLERGDWRADPGRGLWLAVRRHPEGTGGREELCKRECLWRKPEPPEKESSVVE